MIDKRGQLSQLFALYCVLLTHLSHVIRNRRDWGLGLPTLLLTTMKLLENVRVIAIEGVTRDPCETTQRCHCQSFRSGVCILWTGQRP
jgi:hypothetical protein